MRFIPTRFLALGCLIFAAPASACIDGIYEDRITRVKPVDMIPAGAVQLKVNVDEDSEAVRSNSSGSVTLDVVEAVDGVFAGAQVTFSYENRSSCDYFGPAGPNRYVVLFPILYEEGDPVLNDAGEPAFEVIRFSEWLDPEYTGSASASDFDLTYWSESLPEWNSCVRRGGGTAQAIQACNDADDPGSLFQDAKGAVVKYALGGVIFLIVLIFARRRLSRGR